MEDRYKYPSTPYLPWSPNVDPDDERILDLSHFEGREVVVTEKRDGENATLYPDGHHARSIDSRHHPSRNWIKNLQGRIGHEIPEGWRVCGENLYAEHSIRYDDLESYFEVFSIWNDQNRALSWDDTVEWCEMLDLVHVPVMWRGGWDENVIRAIDFDEETTEGYVVRVADAFHYGEFKRNLAKSVRSNHVQTSEHWMHKEVTPNGLADESS